MVIWRWVTIVLAPLYYSVAGLAQDTVRLDRNNLLQYRDAAAQMLAIAIVVATMDWISARLRERLV